MDKGKSMALEYPSDPQSDFEANSTRQGRMASILNEIKKTRILPFKAPPKRARKNFLSSEDDFDMQTKMKRNGIYYFVMSLLRWEDSQNIMCLSTYIPM